METNATQLLQNIPPALTTRAAKVARAAWLSLAALAIGVFLSSLPGYLQFTRQGMHHQPATDSFNALSALASILAFLVSFSLAGVIFRQKWDERMAPFISFYLLAYGIVMAGPLEMWSLYWLGNPQFATNLQAIVMTTPTIALMALFPNGRFVPRWTRWLVAFSLIWIVITLFMPISTLYAAPTHILLLFVLFILSIIAPGLYAQIYRYRYVSSSEERQQTKWVVLGLTLWSLYVLLSTGPYLYLESLPPQETRPWWATATSLGWWMSLNILPFSLTVAVLRYRLWDIDSLINRALVYGALTACVVGLYILAVGALGLLFHTQVNGVTALIATGLVAVLFQPLRERLQRGVNRVLYGQRDEPFAVLTQMGQRVESALTPEMVFPTLVETISQTLKIPYVAIALHQEGGREIAESYGKPSGDLVDFPLIYQGNDIGGLLVARRAPEEEFTQAELNLLSNIARQAGTAVHAVQLTAELQRSRQKLVTALEDERRRIRRDLHDGLGPTLAAHMLKAGAARAVLGDRQPEAGRLLDELENDLENTLGQVRQLVYNLRPPALDQLGLAGAIQEYADQINRGNGTQAGDEGQPGLVIHVSTRVPASALPAAVEVAAYRIVQEGLANVARHSGARECQVELTCDDSVRLSIRDDGSGLPDGYRAGVGLSSMQERAAELGGYCKVKSRPGGGTQVLAIIPIQA
jgi:signal transduction histidine kinase